MRVKIKKPFFQWKEEDLPQILEALGKKRPAPDPLPGHNQRPCCGAGWEAFLTREQLIMLQCDSCKEWWLPSAGNESPPA